MRVMDGPEKRCEGAPLSSPTIGGGSRQDGRGTKTKLPPKGTPGSEFFRWGMTDDTER